MVSLPNPSNYNRFGVALKKGYFSNMDKDTPEYFDLWQEQMDRCVNGYSVGSYWISGFLYWYVNFGTISVLNDETKRKEINLPGLRDIEFELDLHETRAINEGKGLMIIGPRRFGKSFKNTARAVYTATILKEQAGIFAGVDTKLNPAMNMVQQHLIGLKDTELGLPFKGTTKTGYRIGADVRDKETQQFYFEQLGGNIHPRNFNGGKHDAANGLSLKFALFDEVGIWDGLINSYGSSEPCWKDGNVAYGFVMLTGTGGDMEKGTKDAQKMFYDPDAYNLLSFTDYSPNDKPHALFVPGTYSQNQRRDKLTGIVDHGLAKQDILEERDKKKKSKEKNAYFQYVQYYPLTPEESFLRSSGGMFNSALIQAQIENILTSSELTNLPKRGNMEWHQGRAAFVPDNLAQEVDYPVAKGSDKKGCVTIYQEPFKLTNDSTPSGLYLAGLDPYATDKSDSSPSLGSLIIYKKFTPHHPGDNFIVAEYTGRPNTLNEFYEQCRILLKYYNAKCLYESNIKGFKEFMVQRHSLLYLANTPTILSDIFKSDANTNNKYGVTMTRQLKEYLVDLVNNYLEEEYEEGKKNIDKIYSLNLLKELLDFDMDVNTDRVIAFMLSLLMKEETFKQKIINIKSKNDNNGFFSDLFKSELFTKKRNNANSW